MTLKAEDFKQFARNQGKLVMIELFDDIWIPQRADTPRGPQVGPALKLSVAALSEVETTLQKELGRDPTEDELRRRLDELAQAGTNVQEPVRSSLLIGSVDVEGGLVHVQWETQGGLVKTALAPAAIKCVSYVDEGILQSAAVSA